jgi:TolB-like protein/DNA-binding winged helix-turn-helix (wHTH) protein
MRYAFDEFVLDPALRELRCGDRIVHAEPQAFDLILHLLRNRERVVSQDELLEVVWDGRLVSESTFRSRVNAARRLLGDDGRQQRLIRTVARKGLRFQGEVVEHGIATSQEAEEQRPAAGQGVDDWPATETGAPSGSAGERTFPEASDKGDRKPVVAVLPFTNLSGDPDQEHIGDGITEDITTVLVKYRSLLIVARNSAFSFKGRVGDVRQVGADLGADYIVEGSVRRTDGRIRVTAHLIETASGRLIWGDSYDRRVEELFELQDAITAMIASSIEPRIGSEERLRVERKPGNLDAWDLFHLGISHLFKATRKDNREAQRFLRLAIDHDGALAQAYAYLAYAILLSMLYFDAEPEEQRLAEALELARRGIELDPQDAMIRFVHGRALLATRNYRDALDELETAVEMNPTLAIGHCGVGDSLAYEGRFNEAFPHFQRAIELSRYDPQRWAFHAYRALAHLFAREFHLASSWAQKATCVPNCHYWPFSHRVAALGHLQDSEELEKAVPELLKRRPGFTCGLARERLFYIEDSEQLGLYLEGLRRAGIPEE